MEISRQEFAQKLPMVKAAIDECDFMSIDTELSGLHRPGTGKRIETRDYRYEEYKEASERFLIIQFGLCTFKWDAPSGRYIAKPFNFNIFPTSFAGGRTQANRVFSVQAQAFDFLAKQAFDFNKWIYQGIPFMNLPDEEKFVAAKRKMLNDEMPDIPVDDKDRPFLEDVKKKIDTWLESVDKKPKNNDGINIHATNGYLRRLVYQEVRNSYEGLTAEGRQGYIRVIRFSKEQQLKRNKEREELFKNDCEKAVGFRRVIDWISESKKPLVGHNMLLDMCHVIGQFLQPLPDTKEEFKTLATRYFPTMIDTKHIAVSAAEIDKIMNGATDLENLRFETSRQAFENPRVDMNWEFPRYIEEKAHEAGYDAYMTGTAFIKMISYLDSQRNPKEIPTEDETVEPEKEKSQEEVLSSDNGGWDVEPDDDVDPNWTIDDDDEEIYNYGSTFVRLYEDNGDPIPILASVSNKVALVRSAFHYFDFDQEEQGIIKQSNTFIIHLDQKALVENDAVMTALSGVGQFIVEPMDGSSSLVVYDRALADKDTVKQMLVDLLKKETVIGVRVDSILDYQK